jgi:molybdenum cofactor cytidylyltransferase
MSQFKIQNSKFKMGVVILGAGASSRMGRPKLLLPWGDTTVIGQILRQWRELGAAQIAVVHRPSDTALVETLKREELKWSKAVTLQRFNASTHCIVNPQSGKGMFSSVVCAARWRGWRKDISSWAIVLGDQPHLQMDTLRVLLDRAAQNADAICQPVFNGHTGHPVILPRSVFAELPHSGAETLKEFLKPFSGGCVQCPVEDAGLLLDLDRPEDYDKAVKFRLGNI